MADAPPLLTIVPAVRGGRLLFLLAPVLTPLLAGGLRMMPAAAIFRIWLRHRQRYDVGDSGIRSRRSGRPAP